MPPAARTGSRRSRSTPARSPTRSPARWSRRSTRSPRTSRTASAACAAATSTRARPTRPGAALEECLAALEGGAPVAGLRLGHGRHRLPGARGLPARRPRADPARRLRRHVPAVRQGLRRLGRGLRARCRCPTRPRSGAALAGERARPPAGLGRDADQPAAVHRRHRRAGRDRPRRRRAAGRGQHLRLALPAAAAGARRRRRGPLHDQVPGRPLRRGRRRGRGRRRRPWPSSWPSCRTRRARGRARSTPG